MLNKCFEIVSDIENINLKKASDLRSFLNSYRELTQGYALANAAERKDIRDLMSLRVSKVLLALANRSAEKSIETNSSEWIRAAVMGHLIENVRFDYRENFRNLVLINFAAKYVGIDLESIFKELEHISTQQTREMFESFFSRNSELNRLETVGMKLFIDDSGKASFISSDLGNVK